RHECHPPPAIVTSMPAPFPHSHLSARFPYTTLFRSHGASGGVGSLALQFAKLRGVKVLATASGEDGLTFVKGLGADAELRELQRSEEHTSELQSRGHLVCRLVVAKKKNCVKWKSI